MNISNLCTIIGFHKNILSIKNPKIHDKYISSSSLNSLTVNHIYEFNNDNWIDIFPLVGMIVWDKKTIYLYNGITWIKLAQVIDHDELVHSKPSHPDINEHINNDKLHIKEQQVNHMNIANVGLFTHANLDKHVLNDSTAHFGQALTKSSTPLFESIKLSRQEPLDQCDVVTKNYVDNKLIGINFQKQVISFYDPINVLPECPKFGDRYISLSNGNSWKMNKIYEYTENDWLSIEPIMNTVVFVESGNIYSGCLVLYNGKDWVKFGISVDHDCLLNSGIYKHFDIDNHINSKNAHFDQDLTQFGFPTFSGVTITDMLYSKNNKLEELNVSKQIKIGKANLRDFNSDISLMCDEKSSNICCAVSSKNKFDSTNFIHIRSGGDVYMPQNLQKNTIIGSTLYSGYDGQRYNLVGSIQCIATEDYDMYSHGSELLFSTTTNNSHQPSIKFKISHDGNIKCFSTTDSENVSSGSLVIKGGAGVNKNMHIGDNLYVGNNLYFNSLTRNSVICNSTFVNFDSNTLTLCGGGDILRGSHVITSGNDSLLKGDLKLTSHVGDIVFETKNTKKMLLTNEGQLTLFSTLNSTSSSSGSFIINGGVGIAKDIHIDGTLNASNIYTSLINTEKCIDINVNKTKILTINDSCIIHSTLQSTCISSGALIINGGIGVKGCINAVESSIDRIKCNSQFNLPVLINEPIAPTIGTTYYDDTNDVLKIMTKTGWRKVKYE